MSPDLASFVRRALIALPFAVMLVLGGLLYMIFVGQYSAVGACAHDMELRHMSTDRFAEVFELDCETKMKGLQVSNPALFKCASHCMVDATWDKGADACQTECAGFDDPLALTWPDGGEKPR